VVSTQLGKSHRTATAAVGRRWNRKECTLSVIEILAFPSSPSSRIRYGQVTAVAFHQLMKVEYPVEDAVQ